MDVYVVAYTHKYGTDVGAYSTEEKGWAAIAKIKADNAEEFTEGHEQSSCDLICCEVDSPFVT